MDRAGVLLRSLGPSLSAPEDRAALQLLFERVPGWEHRWLGAQYESYIEAADRSRRSVLLRRRSEAAYHIEVRLGVSGRLPERISAHVAHWLASWSTFDGGAWRRLQPVPSTGRAARALDVVRRPYENLVRREPHRLRYQDALVQHDPSRFAARRSNRDISGRELAALLPIPWRERHPGLHYSGAPEGRPPPDLSMASGATTGAIGATAGAPVRLPAGWRHLAILGRTRSGKSTAAQNLVLEILRTEPLARVVVLEPTGNLIRALAERIPSEVARGAITIDPAHPTFTREGIELASVPLNLLQLSSARAAVGLEAERRAERLAGDVLQAIRNAWGEESVGGRADFILRAVLQGLSGLEGATLVDAYTALSDKNALRRLERLATGDCLRSTLRVHLPKLDYTFTISSLDKVGKIATNPLFRKALCQRADPVPVERLLEHRLLLLDLGKGTLGTEGAWFLGAIFLTRLWSAIQERPDPAVPIYLVVDEFHHYAVPAFADMLSEGARLGLHIVPITQFLGRIPPKVRSAMIGNVDAWLMFSLGSEDLRDAWQIVRGGEFGWKPEDLDGGLRPHQAALATPGSLVKVDTTPPLAVSGDVARTLALIEASSRRYARPEDSGASPLGLPMAQVVRFLEALDPERPRSRSELGGALDWRPELVSAATSLALSEGDAAEDGAGGLRLLRRGRYFGEAVAAARNEGEEHCGLVADAAAFLDGLGVVVRIVPQGGAAPLPDAEFERRGRGYNIEVECSTLTKHVDQVARNIRKAVVAGRRCLVVVPNQEAAEAFVCGVEEGAAPPEFWESIGLVWRVGPGRMVPYQPASGPAWGWLFGRDDRPSDPGPTEHLTPDPPLWRTASTPDSETVRDLANRLLASGKDEATALDFARIASTLQQPVVADPLRLGRALNALGVQNHRVRMVNGQARVYDLRPLLKPPGSAQAPTGGGSD